MKYYFSYILTCSVIYFGFFSVNNSRHFISLDYYDAGSHTVVFQDTAHTGYQVFEPVLDELQQTSIPLKLPTYLAAERHSIGDFHAIVETISDDEYIIQIAAIPECNWNTFCLIGKISGKMDHDFLPPEESITIQLAGGITGYFSESVCTISCSLSMMTWHQNGFTYRVGKKSSQNVLIEIANSAIESDIGN
jgi:hypothetical protein